MKKSVLRIKMAALTIALLCIVVLSTSCTAAKMRDYYSQKNNYIRAAGIVTHISYNEDGTVLYLGFSDLTPQFDDNSFKIVGDSLQAAKEKGIDEKIKIGCPVEFITAPRYFGDGYVMPIVGISVNEEELLEFEEGVDNLLKWLG